MHVAENTTDRQKPGFIWDSKMPILIKNDISQTLLQQVIDDKKKYPVTHLGRLTKRS
jgi:hypothetical protein